MQVGLSNFSSNYQAHSARSLTPSHFADSIASDPRYSAVNVGGGVPFLLSSDIGKLQPTPVLVVCAHPDDESLGIGALVASLVAQGVAVQMVYVTSGDKGQDKTGRGLSGESLGRYREMEQVQATKSLGVALPPLFLRFPDGEVTENRNQIEPVLSRILQRLQPKYIVTLNSIRGITGHPDHINTAKMMERVTATYNAQTHYPAQLLEQAYDPKNIKDFLSAMQICQTDAWDSLNTVSKDLIDISVKPPLLALSMAVSAIWAHLTQFTLLERVGWLQYFTSGSEVKLNFIDATNKGGES